MKIKSVWVESYGSLKNFAVPGKGTLTDGLNLLFGPNEAGKSQLKGFLEEILFPRANQRGLKDGRPFGRVGFMHQNALYELEVARKGNNVFRQLLMDEILTSGDVPDLFPSMKIAGHEVFANLYSFGIDELLASNTSANGVLTEHLFGAVAGGKGVSISSIFESLDNEIKMLTSKAARSRSLPRVMDELESANKQRLEWIADEKTFMERFGQRTQIVEKISNLEIQLEKEHHELRLYEEMQRMAEMYEQYVTATSFLGRYPHLSSLNSDSIRSLENYFSQAGNLKADISEFEKRLMSASDQLKVLQFDLDLVDRRDKIRIAERILEDVKSIREEFYRRSSEFDASKADAARAAAGSTLAVESYLDSGDGSTLQSAIGALESIRGSFEMLSRQWSDHLSSPLLDVSREDLFAKQRATDVAIRKAETLLEASAAKPAVSKGRSWIWSGFFALFAAVAIGVSYGERTVSTPFGLALEAILGLAVAGVIYLLVRTFGKAGGLASQAVNMDLQDIGVEYYEPRQIMKRLNDFKQDREAIDSVIRMQTEWQRLAHLIDSYGITMDSSAPFDKTFGQVSTLVYLMKDIAELRRMKRSVEQLRIRLAERRSDLLDLLRGEFSEINLPEDASIDLLDITVSNLAERLNSNLGIKSDAEKLQRDIETYEAELARIAASLDSVNHLIDEQLVRVGSSHEQISEDFIELLREYDRNQAKKASFLHSAESVFGEKLQDVLLRFKMGHVELADSIQKLTEQINADKNDREALLGSKAEIDAEEKRLLHVNPVAEIQASVESLLIEAEELAGKLRVLGLAKQLLQNANTRFEELHQPELMRLSSEIFARVTQNRYPSILKKEYGKGESILARNVFGQDIADSSLSRGTREQLYISIRLALITRPNSLDIPLLMDDVMVNADKDRAQGLAKELELVSRSRQIIYFCAKPETVALFETAGAEFSIFEMERL
ncbi:MAG: hypothetical protein EPN30_10295 [Actinomycetota bacterium]|nr:MAG: hypothetical protein EPN30_10295 [Actinomycetota bacterium]